MPIIVDISARFLFPSKAGAVKAATWIRRRYDARVRLGPATPLRRSREWRLEARIPKTRFDLERLRLLADELAEVAEAGDGVLVTWEAVRPDRGVTQARFLHRIRPRATLIVGTDLAIAMAGVALQAVVLVAAAVVAFVLEGAIWLLVGRTSARR